MRQSIRKIAKDSGLAQTSGESNDEDRSITLATKRPSSDIGEIFVDRSKHSGDFEFWITKYQDEDGRIKEGPWYYTYKRLDDEAPKGSYPTIKGNRIQAKAVLFEIVTKNGRQRCSVDRESVNKNGQLFVEVTEPENPPILVSRSAYRADEELVHLILNSESLSLNKAEQSDWLSQVASMSSEKRNQLKDILTEEAKKLKAAERVYGFEHLIRAPFIKLRWTSSLHDVCQSPHNSTHIKRYMLRHMHVVVADVTC